MKILNTKFIAAIGVAFCFVVIGLGAWTRLADAGLGCPDWPGCYGPINNREQVVRTCSENEY